MGALHVPLPIVRAVPQDPAGGRAAFSDFLSQHQLLLGRALFNVEIYLLPRDSYRSILLEMKNLVSRWGGQLSFVHLPSHVSISDARCDPNRTMIPGLIVDAVHRVLPVSIKDIKAPPTIAKAHGSHYMLAVAKHQDQLYVILDLDQILSTSETMSLDQVKLA